MRQFAPDAPYSHGVDRIVRKATSPEIHERYPHAGELSTDIAKLIEEQLPPSSIKRTMTREEVEEYGVEDKSDSRDWSRRAFWWGAAALAAAELFALGVWKLLQ